MRTDPEKRRLQNGFPSKLATTWMIIKRGLCCVLCAECHQFALCATSVYLFICIFCTFKCPRLKDDQKIYSVIFLRKLNLKINSPKFSTQLLKTIS